MNVITNKINFCVECGAKAKLSRNKLCENCSVKKVKTSIKHLKQKNGYYYDQWIKSNADKEEEVND